MIRVQVLYFEGCPNHRPTVRLVQQVAGELGVAAEIEGVEVKSAEEAERLRFLGSPTVRVNGVDIEPSARASKAYGFACRTYDGSGTPSRALLVAALASASSGEKPRQSG